MRPHQTPLSSEDSFHSFVNDLHPNQQDKPPTMRPLPLLLLLRFNGVEAAAMIAPPLHPWRFHHPTSKVSSSTEHGNIHAPTPIPLYVINFNYEPRHSARQQSSPAGGTQDPRTNYELPTSDPLQHSHLTKRQPTIHTSPYSQYQHNSQPTPPCLIPVTLAITTHFSN